VLVLQVDVWSCGVILYALLCGSLPFDDENIPNLFKKIKGGIFTLPGHMSDEIKDLISRMLVVDPLQRITIPEIRRHRWFTDELPLYLSVTPDQIMSQIRSIDQDVLMEVVMKIGFDRQELEEALEKQERNQMTVAYYLILDSKRRRLLSSSAMMQSPGQLDVAAPPPPPPAAAAPVPAAATTAAAAGPTAAATGRPVRKKDVWAWRAPGTGTHGQVSGAGHIGSCEHRKAAAPAGTAAFLGEAWNLPDVAACKASCAANATCAAVQWSASTKYTRCVLFADAPERVLPVPGYECWLKELAPQGGGARGGSARGRSPSKEGTSSQYIDCSDYATNHCCYYYYQEGTSSQYIDCSDPGVATSEGTSYAKLKGFTLKQGGATCQHHAKPGANSLDPRPLLDPS